VLNYACGLIQRQDQRFGSSADLARGVTCAARAIPADRTRGDVQRSVEIPLLVGTAFLPDRYRALIYDKRRCPPLARSPDVAWLRKLSGFNHNQLHLTGGKRDLGAATAN
jgi:hypothetical protein